MAAINITSNLDEVSQKLIVKLKKLQDKEYLLRPICVDVIDLMTKRIHIDGKEAGESEIGTYNPSYLRIRQKAPYNRTSDKKIIVSLTRQLENDWSVIATKNGYGIGFKNRFNLQKARWVEQNKQKRIFSLSASELQFSRERLTDLIHNALK